MPPATAPTAVYFYPRSPCGERPSILHKNICVWGFLSTLSLRRATYWVGGYGTANNFYPRSPCGERQMGVPIPALPHDFYPRSPCGERLLPSWELYQMLRISIHALLAESDTPAALVITGVADFYPRSPCGERPAGPDRQRAGPGISIHALLAESDGRQQEQYSVLGISIHALLAESDPLTRNN